MSLSSDSPEEMTEVKVRLFGTDLGVGISRCTAIVRSSFMPPVQLAPLLQPTQNNTCREKKKNEITVDSGSSDKVRLQAASSSSSKRKRKPANTRPVKAGDEAAHALVAYPPLFDSETRQGERPTVSFLSLFPFSVSNAITSSASVDPHDLDGKSLLTEGSNSTLISSGIVENALPIMKKNLTAAVNDANTFWKMFEDDKYFLPFSRKTHKVEELSLKGGDYDDLSSVKPSGAPCSWHGHDKSDLIDPIEAVLFGYSTNFNANDAEHGTNPIYFTESDKSITVESDQMGAPAPEVQSFQNSKSGMPYFGSRECIDIDFLYQRLVASFVLPHETAVSGGSVLEAAAETGSQSSPSPSLSSVCTNFNSDSASNTTTESLVTTIKDASSVTGNAADALAVENTGDDYSTSSSVSRRRKYEMLCGDNYDESSTISMNRSGQRNGSRELLHLNEINGATESLSYSHSNGLEVCQSHTHTRARTRTCTDENNGCGDTSKLSGYFPSFSSATADMNIDGNVKHAQYRIDGVDSGKLFDLRRDQRVLIELAELGLIHQFDNEINTDAVECLIDESDSMGVSGMDFIGVQVDVEVDSGNVCMSSNSSNVVKREGWHSVTERFQYNRADDEICSSIRCMVESLKTVEFDLNNRIASLRKILDTPNVVQESENKRRSYEASRTLQTKWQKLRKKVKR